MEQNDQVYLKLRKHLDNQAVGFPVTKSGAEIKLLKHIFTKKEAEVVCYLSYKYEPVEELFSRVEPMVKSPEEFETILDRIQQNGGIEVKIKNGKKHYCCAPLVVGMYEFQLGRLTPEFIKDFDEYISDQKFGIEFLSTELPQMRTIPVEKSIRPKNNVSTFDEVAILLQQAEEPLVIFECICRKKNVMKGETCKMTDRKETCLVVGSMAEAFLTSNLGKEVGREVSRDEAMSIIVQNQKDGLVLQPSNTEKAEFICSCCGCCCGMLAVHKNIPKPLDYWATNFYAEVDTSTCEGCGICEKRCQVGAVSIHESKEPAVVDLNRCLGCGVCVPNCPTESISLVNKSNEVRPPQTREDLYEIIMANKKGRLGKLRLTGKMFVDAIRTGETHLLRSKR